MDFNSFWIEGESSNPKLTVAMVKQAERRYKCKLPDTYISLLNIKNGYWTNDLIYPTKFETTWADDHVGFDSMAGISIDDNWGEHGHNIFLTEDMIDEWELPSNIILLCGDGHWWIALDFRHGEEALVSWIDCEIGEDCILANTFDEFFNGLIRNKE